MNANGPVWGTGDSKGTLVWVDLLKHTANEVKIPPIDSSLSWSSNVGPMQILLPS